MPQDAGNDYILPGFVDLQVNGSHGIDVMTATADALPLSAVISRAKGQQHGCQLP